MKTITPAAAVDLYRQAKIDVDPLGYYLSAQPEQGRPRPCGCLLAAATIAATGRAPVDISYAALAREAGLDRDYATGLSSGFSAPEYPLDPVLHRSNRANSGDAIRANYEAGLADGVAARAAVDASDLPRVVAPEEGPA
jgi:hypothetical protein